MPGHYKNVQGTFWENTKNHDCGVPDVYFRCHACHFYAYPKYLTNFQAERQNIKENQWRFFLFNKLDSGLPENRDSAGEIVYLLEFFIDFDNF